MSIAEENKLRTHMFAYLAYFLLGAAMNGTAITLLFVMLFDFNYIYIPITAVTAYVGYRSLRKGTKGWKQFFKENN
jgi:hypothetical protein